MPGQPGFWATLRRCVCALTDYIIVERKLLLKLEIKLRCVFLAQTTKLMSSKLTYILMDL
jgi:hypothetical protein